MKGRIVPFMPHDRCFVIRPDGGTACDVMAAEDDIPSGSQGLAVELSLIASDRGWRATNVKVEP